MRSYCSCRGTSKHYVTVPLMIVCAFLTPSALAQTSPFPYQKIALSGDPAPGAGAGVVFSYFGSQINAEGTVLLIAGLSGPGIPANLQGIWTGSSAGLNPIVSQAGDVSGNIVLNDLGEVGFITVDYNPSAGTFDGSAWIADQTGLHLISKSGDPASDGTGTVYFDGIPTTTMSRGKGVVVFGGIGSNGNLGVWSGSIGSGVQLIAADETPAPDTDGTFDDVFDDPFSEEAANPVSINAAGAVAFRATYSNATSFEVGGIWAGQPGNIHLIVKDGDSVPGEAAGATFTQMNPAYRRDTEKTAINDTGEIAFAASTIGPDHSLSSGIFAGQPGNFQLLAKEGQQAPGRPTGSNFTYFDDPLINNEGDVAFKGVTSNGMVGIWVNRLGTLELVAAAGDAAPGGGFFGGYSFDPERLWVNPVQLSEAGRVAFAAGLTDGEEGVWCTDAADQLQLVAEAGEIFDVDPGPGIDFRTISTIGWPNAYPEAGLVANGWQRQFSDNDQLVLSLNFTDGSSGVFVFQVPEPGGLTDFAFVGALLMRRRKGCNGVRGYVIHRRAISE